MFGVHRYPGMLCVALVWMLAGCGGEVEERTTADGPIRITYWCAQNPQERELAAELVAEWNAANPDIQVKVQPLPAGQSSEEVLLAAVVAGTTPDICSNIWPGIVPDFVEADGVYPLSDFADFDSLLTDRVPADARTQFRSADGGYYQIPWKTNPIMLLYNKRIFQEVGLERPPATWSGFIEAGEKIGQDRDNDGRPDRWIGYRDLRPIWHQRRFDFFAMYVAVSKGKTFFDAEGNLAIDPDVTRQVFGFFHDLYSRNYFPHTTFAGSPIMTQRVATEFVGPWQIGWLEDNAPDDFSYGFVPLPKPDGFEGPDYTFGDFKNIVIFNTTEHPEATWKFAKHLVSKEADLRLLELTRQIPVREGLLSDSTYTAFFEDNPNVTPFAEATPYVRGVDSVPSIQEMLDAVAHQFEAAAVYGVVSPAEATKEALERIEMIIEWNK